MPALLTLGASRNVVWAPTIELAYSGGPLPLTGATIAMQIRLYPGAAGAALKSLAAVPFEDVAAPTDADPDGRVLRLSPTISAADLTAMPGLNQPEAGEPQTFAYDLVVTYADDVDEILAGGDFILSPGVTV